MQAMKTRPALRRGSIIWLPVEEIASRCGIRESRAKSMLHRLRGRLRRNLEKEGWL